MQAEWDKKKARRKKVEAAAMQPPTDAAVRLYDEGVELAMNIRMRRSAEGREVTITGKRKLLLTYVVAGNFQSTSVSPCLGRV